MKSDFCVLMILFLISCSSLENYNQVDDRINYEFRPQTIEFQREFRQLVRLPIRFGINDPELMGVCQIRTDGHRQILINKERWSVLTDEQKEELVFHELGHCIFNLPHLDGQYMLTGCPMSLMAPRVFSAHQAEACYSRYKNYYLGQIKVGLGK